MVDFLRLESIDDAIDEASWEKGVVKLGERAAAMLDAAVAELSPCEWNAAAIEAALDAAARSAGFVKRRWLRRHAPGPGSGAGGGHGPIGRPTLVRVAGGAGA